MFTQNQFFTNFQSIFYLVIQRNKYRNLNINVHIKMKTLDFSDLIFIFADKIIVYIDKKLKL